jgi:hypothetical protein
VVHLRGRQDALDARELHAEPSVCIFTSGVRWAVSPKS